MEDRCVCCGRIIPEGRQVCPICEKEPTGMKMAELKPCPFCGGEAEYIPIDYLPEPCGYVRCGNCRVKQYWFSPKNEAIEEWNRRVKNVGDK